MNNVPVLPGIQDLLGSVHVLSYTLSEVVEAGLLQKVARGQLTLTQLRFLKLVSLPGTHTITGVSAFMGISKAAASKAADRLVRGGFLRRAEGERDRRAAHLSLTPSGRRILGAFESSRKRVMADVADSLPMEDLRPAIQLLDSLSVRLIKAGVGRDDLCVRCRIHFLDKCLLRQHLERECEYEVQRLRFQPDPGRA